MAVDASSAPQVGPNRDRGRVGLSADRVVGWLRAHRRLAIGGVAGLFVIGILVVWLRGSSSPVQYVTAPVTRGDVVTTITASGTINPVTTVQVGTYVSGTIESLTCDYNTKVHKGQLCAKIDPKPYQIIVDEDQADLDHRQGAARQGPGQSRLHQAHQQRDDAPVQGERRLARRRRCGARRQQSGARARRLDAAAIAQKAAVLKAAQINLDYTNIVSPVDGTVVSRNVTAGQTVAASLQTPTLFLIATDLTKMQVDTNVSESDIAGARQGADASFTVDAFPDRTFHGPRRPGPAVPDQRPERHHL